MKESYLQAINLIERLHRQFLEVVKHELDGLGIQDINNVQAIILYNIGEEEVTVGELTNRGYYLGSNVSYNLKKMVENKYLVQERSPHDRRSIRVRLSDKGRELCAKVAKMIDQHAQNFSKSSLTEENLKELNQTLTRMGRFWNETLLRSGHAALGAPGGSERRQPGAN